MKILVDRNTVIKIAGSTLYIINSDDEYKIDLIECYNNWTKEKNITVDKNRPKGIGERDIYAKPPYFQLYDKNKTIIECNNKKGIFDFITSSKIKNDKILFIKLQQIISNNGFTTYDLS